LQPSQQAIAGGAIIGTQPFNELSEILLEGKYETLQQHNIVYQ